jgi:hypothetical protein
LPEAIVFNEASCCSCLSGVVDEYPAVLPDPDVFAVADSEVPVVILSINSDLVEEERWSPVFSTGREAGLNALHAARFVRNSSKMNRFFIFLLILDRVKIHN